jgi:hypothetical protein
LKAGQRKKDHTGVSRMEGKLKIQKKKTLQTDVELKTAEQMLEKSTSLVSKVTGKAKYNTM